jgi:dsRNA-specific ribonuclease
MVYKGNVNYGSLRKPRVICYRHLSEVVESIIGAAFLNGSDIYGPIFHDCCEGLVIALLEELNLPLHWSLEQTRCSDARWFKATHACIYKGFNFTNDIAWCTQYKEIMSIFHREVYIKERLIGGSRRLLSILKQLNPNDSLDLTAEMEIILACALFNDSLDSDSEDSIGANPPIIFARFRENLFFVGESALHLAVTTECVKRYPYASAGDLHMLKICCTSDDSIAYIALKHGIGDCLYEEESECIDRFKILVNAADMYGQKLQSKLPNDVYKDRWNRSWWCKNGNDMDVHPSYMGMGGGCLAGEKTKVGKMLTTDLTYGFKSIIGSLVLSVGLERMWCSFITLFEEILMIYTD